jgi:hypothetical protein
MSRREEWDTVLGLELDRWAAKPWPELVSALERGNLAYEVVFGSKAYQLEVDLLEDTERYLHVCIAVDDGSLPGSVRPATRSFICLKS